MAFRIQPRVRLQEWVAEERGWCAAEGLEHWMREWDLLDPTRLGYGQTVLA